MPKIIQIFKAVSIFQKPDYTPESRKKLGVWPDSVNSTSGYAKDDILILPSSLDTKGGIEQAELIILIDDICSEHGFASAEKSQHYHFRQIKAPVLTELFRIKGMDPVGFELFLDYSGMATTIGVPRREDHKIAELRLGKPVRYRINGKSDFTLSGRKQRHFHEFDYLILDLGSVDNIKFVDDFRVLHKKSISPEACKLVDERKMLT